MLETVARECAPPVRWSASTASRSMPRCWRRDTCSIASPGLASRKPHVDRAPSRPPVLEERDDCFAPGAGAAAGRPQTPGTSRDLRSRALLPVRAKRRSGPALSGARAQPVWTLPRWLRSTARSARSGARQGPAAARRCPRGIGARARLHPRAGLESRGRDGYERPSS